MRSESKYINKAVAFLDILGFRALTQQETERANSTIEFIDEQLRHVVCERVEHSASGMAFDVRLFSDCICLVCDCSAVGVAALLDSVAYLSLHFAIEKIPLRGGVASGRHYHNARMIFSEALVSAYHLESKQAKWPRTLVTADVAGLAREKVPFLIRRDPDGRDFVDYLEWCSGQGAAPGHHPYDEHRACITAVLNNPAVQQSVREKYEWLACYHDEKLRELSKRSESRELIRAAMFVRPPAPDGH